MTWRISSRKFSRLLQPTTRRVCDWMKLLLSGTTPQICIRRSLPHHQYRENSNLFSQLVHIVHIWVPAENNSRELLTVSQHNKRSLIVKQTSVRLLYSFQCLVLSREVASIYRFSVQHLCPEIFHFTDCRKLPSLITIAHKRIDIACSQLLCPITKVKLLRCTISTS
jgi:hypothetical protein